MDIHTMPTCTSMTTKTPVTQHHKTRILLSWYKMTNIKYVTNLTTAFVTRKQDTFHNFIHPVINKIMQGHMFWLFE